MYTVIIVLLLYFSKRNRREKVKFCGYLDDIRLAGIRLMREGRPELASKIMGIENKLFDGLLSEMNKTHFDLVGY